MFDHFGEFDSWEEINRAAAAQWDQGEDDAILAIAKENGIDEDDAKDYISGETEQMTTIVGAAIGKLEVESDNIKGLCGSCADWVEELIGLASENEEFAIAVRKKGKCLNEFMARCLDYGWKNSWEVDKDIMNRTKDLKGIMHGHMCRVGLPDKRMRKKIAMKYYMEE